MHPIPNKELVFYEESPLKRKVDFFVIQIEFLQKLWIYILG
ncbi:hypothetical protein DB42_BB00230 [Neochlamydia sp. EPS4]|nr:hypothetical protein DB42_BB00230 [Neochlamydia sp. EPS4]